MPYIKPDERERIDFLLAELKSHLHTAFNASDRKGQLNYAITTLLLDSFPSDPRYSDINDQIGVLECAKLELYRRRAAPYEDSKAQENGDVFTQSSNLLGCNPV